MTKTGDTITTTDHRKIRNWTEKRGGQPASVKNNNLRSEEDILKIHFPFTGADETVEKITWEEFFEKFEEQALSFTYQETTKDGNPSLYCRLQERYRTDEMD